MGRKISILPRERNPLVMWGRAKLSQLSLRLQWICILQSFLMQHRSRWSIYGTFLHNNFDFLRNKPPFTSPACFHCSVHNLIWIRKSDKKRKGEGPGIGFQFWTVQCAMVYQNYTWEFCSFAPKLAEISCVSRSNPAGPETHLLLDGGSSGWRAGTRLRRGSTPCSRAAAAGDLTVALLRGGPRRPAVTNTVFLR